MTATDWPALLQRLADRKVDVRRILGVKRMQVWRWQHRVQKPNGDHAATLIALDRGGQQPGSVSP